MSEPARKLATYADVLAAPEYMVAELIDEIFTFRRVLPNHTPLRRAPLVKS